MWITWREAMSTALYGPGGFYPAGEPARRHFRTSVHTSPGFAEALVSVVREVDAALGHPPSFDLVDIGSGDGELLVRMLAAAARHAGLARRIAALAVEVAPRPAGLDPAVGWRSRLPGQITGLVIANEWLDNVPVDVAELGPDGPRLLLVDPASGGERPGPPLRSADLAWLDTWWPLREVGDRAEIGRPRCEAWAAVIRSLRAGVAIAADYCHDRADRPREGTLAGYRLGRMVSPVPDGSRDITAHVALDACAAAGHAAAAAGDVAPGGAAPGDVAAAAGGAAAEQARGGTLLTTQRAALRALGVAGRPPPPALAAVDPAGYLAALGQASRDAELTDPAGLGGFGWLVQAVGIGLPASLAALAARGA